MKVKEESEKVGLNLNIQEMKIMASVPITSWEMKRASSSPLSYSRTESDEELYTTLPFNVFAIQLCCLSLLQEVIKLYLLK